MIFTNEETMLKSSSVTTWSDKPISALKKLQALFKIKYKTLPASLKLKPFKSLSKSLKGKSKGIHKFSKFFVKNSKKDKDRAIFIRDFQTEFKFVDEIDLLSTESSNSEGIKKNTTCLLSIIRRHLSINSNGIAKMLKQFISIFNKHYVALISKVAPLKTLYEEGQSVTCGDVSGKDISEQSKIDYEILGNEIFLILAERCIQEIKTVFEMMTEALPMYYEGCISKNMYDLIKDELKSYITAHFIDNNAYNIIFTCSRLSTLESEQQLLNCIKKAGMSHKKFAHNELSLLEDLYNQIHPDFRIVTIDLDESSHQVKTSNKCKNNLTLNIECCKQGEDVQKSKEISLKYETGADKINSLNAGETLLEKILMIKWVAESIKQDNEIYITSKSKRLMMCADTMISIFSYVIALSGNHLLYAHLFYTNSLASRNTKDLGEEGYYLCTLEASLSLLCEYGEQTSELMISIYQNETCICREKEFTSMVTNDCSPLKKTKEGKGFSYNCVESCEGSLMQNEGQYISK